MAKKLTADEVVTALMATNTVTEAAQLLGVSRRTVHNYMSDEGFKERMEAAQRAQEERLAALRESAAAEAIHCLVGVVRDDGNPFSDVTTRDKIAAARVLLGTADTKRR